MEDGVTNMKLWLLSQRTNLNYDTYDSAVVAAETEDEARVIHPGGQDGGWGWVSPNEVEVELVGTATPGTSAGVVCASFNAG